MGENDISANKSYLKVTYHNPHRARDSEVGRAMTSAPGDTARVQYQIQCIRNPRLDDAVYSHPAPLQAAKNRLLRAYVVAGVLIGASLLMAIVPVVYVASTSKSTVPHGGSNWTVCWPCRSSSSGACCAALPRTSLRCDTITATSNKAASCWPDDSYHLVLKENRRRTCPESDDKVMVQLRGWISASSKSSSPAMDNVTISVPGIYVVYSKITFGCSSSHVFTNRSTSHVYQHRINATDGRGGRSASLAASQRGQSRLDNQICYNSFLAVAAKFYVNDSIYVVASPFCSIQPSQSATQFGVFRVG